MALCLICKQEIEQGKEINCAACGHSYHREHLKIYLSNSKDCVNCQYTLDKEVFDQFDPEETDGREGLVSQLLRIFPYGAPPEVQSYYAQNHPHGLTSAEYVNQVSQMYLQEST